LRLENDINTFAVLRHLPTHNSNSLRILEKPFSPFHDPAFGRLPISKMETNLQNVSLPPWL
jgi:hypothetical protein